MWCQHAEVPVHYDATALNHFLQQMELALVGLLLSLPDLTSISFLFGFFSSVRTSIQSLEEFFDRIGFKASEILEMPGITQRE
ncbi:hypothetical protein TNCT_509391 [Trichonephila clavata]|uniref:Uncharacterized protein n=1 Tax=Trichonephila clavata TaxID=2740835 RepID=A0A8X6LAX9_TRICU|nr:hypothetical protein TNCT_509391 [Trichonephila clavata]